MLVFGGVFFQAAGGMRDGRVTGIQTCTLPILAQTSKSAVSRVSKPADCGLSFASPTWKSATQQVGKPAPRHFAGSRSEERRVGKEGRSHCSAYAGERRIGMLASESS